MICSKYNKLYPNLNGIMKQPHVIWGFIHDIWSYSCISAHPGFDSIVLFVEPHVALYKQPYVDIICARFESFPMCNYCMTSIPKVLVFSILCTILWAPHPPAPPLPHFTFCCITLLFRNAHVSIFRYWKKWKITFNMIPNIPWYVKYFWCENYNIVILEKLCNSSTLLMELFVICGLPCTCSAKATFFLHCL